MDFNYQGPMSDKELADEIQRCRWKAHGRYRSSKPGHDFREWVAERDRARVRLARLEQIQEQRAEDAAKGESETAPLTEVEQRCGVCLDDILREYYATPPHLRYLG